MYVVETLTTTLVGLNALKTLVFGKTLSSADTIAQHYILSLQVKLYLSKDGFTSFSVILIHPENGWLQNVFAKLKKFSCLCDWHFDFSRTPSIL